MTEPTLGEMILTLRAEQAELQRQLTEVHERVERAEAAVAEVERQAAQKAAERFVRFTESLRYGTGLRGWPIANAGQQLYRELTGAAAQPSDRASLS